jgi:hypothetical protein
MIRKALRRVPPIVLWFGALTLGAVIYVRTHPLVFNESFMAHAHCIAGASRDLLGYALDHDGRYPIHPNGYGDALVLIEGGWDEALTGPGYTAAVFDRVRKTGEDAPESEFGRVYVQGLSTKSDSRLAILFDKVPTPGGDHTQHFHRLFAPLCREVLFVKGDHTTIREKDWPTFAKRQVELLIEAGFSREKAEEYYAATP